MAWMELTGSGANKRLTGLPREGILGDSLHWSVNTKDSLSSHVLHGNSTLGCKGVPFYDPLQLMKILWLATFSVLY